MKNLKVIVASVVLATSSAAATADYYGGYGPYGYAPYPAPTLTQEQIKQIQDNQQAQREAFEKARQQMMENAKAQREAFARAQQEAFERHQEAMKNWQAQAPVYEPAPVVDAPADFFEDPAWVKEIEAEHEARIGEFPAFGEMPEFVEPEFDAPAFAEAPEFETPEWVKKLDAEHEARMKEFPAFGELPEFTEPEFDRPAFPEAPAFAEAPEFETPEWVKELDAEHEARMKDIPAFDDIPEFDAAEFEAPEFPDFKEMEERRAQFIKESDERRAQWEKEIEERRAASKKRHEEFMKKFNKVSTDEAVEEAAEQQS